MANYPDDFTKNTNNVLDQFSQLTDTYNTAVDVIGSVPTSTNKINHLQQKKQQKIDRLNPDATLDLYNNMDIYTNEYGITKDSLNSYTPEQLQEMLGSSVNDKVYYDDKEIGPYQMKQDAEGEWNKTPFSGTTQHVYVAPSKDGNMKLGLAGVGFRERYTPGLAAKEGLTTNKNYGWAPGEKGVDPTKEPYLDIALPYDEASRLEFLTHSNKGQIANRAGGASVADYIKNVKPNVYGKGASEYTTQNAPMWNINSSNTDLPEQVVTPHIPKFLGDTSTPRSKAIGVIHDNAEYEGEPLLGQFADGVARNARGFAGGVARVIGDTAKLANDLETRAIYESAKRLYDFNEKDANELADRFQFLTKEKLDTMENAIAGEDFVTATADDTKKMEEHQKKAFKDVTWSDPSSYGKVNLPEAYNMFKTGLSSPEMTFKSLGYMLGNLIGLPEKAAIKMAGKGTLKALEYNAKKDVAKEMLSKAAKTDKLIAAGKITTEDAVKKGMTLLDPAKKAMYEKTIQLSDRALSKIPIKNKFNAFVAKNANILHLGAVTNEQDMDDYYEKHGERASLQHALLGFAANAVGAKIDLWADKTALMGTKEGFSALIKKAGKTRAQKMLTGVISGAAKMAEGGIAELPAEYIQSGIQAFNNTYKDDNAAEALTKAFHDATQGAAFGAASGIHMAGPSAGSNIITNTFTETDSDKSYENKITSDTEPTNATSDEQAQDLALDKLYTHLHEKGEPLSEEDKPLAHASVERHLNNTLQSLALAEENINAEIAKENPDTEFIGSLEKEKENLEDKISILLDMRNHTAEDGVIYNNRPIKEIDNDLTQTIEQLNNEPKDPKLIKKKRQLLLEKYIASHPLAKKANENGEDTEDSEATFDTVLSQKLYGGVTKDGYRTGIVNMVTPLFDDSISEHGKRAVKNNIERFLESQSAKEKAIEAAKTKFEEQGKDAEENPTPVIARYFTPTGTEATFEYRGIASEKTLEKIKKENEFLHSILHYATNPVELESIVSDIGSNQSDKNAPDDFFDASKGEPRSNHALESEEGINTNFENKKTHILNNTEDTSETQNTIENKITELNDLLGNKQHENFSKQLEETIESIPSFSTDILNQLKDTRGLKSYVTNVKNGINLMPKLLTRLTKEPNEQGTPTWNARAYRAVTALEKYAKAANKIIESEAYQKIQQNAFQEKLPNIEQTASNTNTSMNEVSFDADEAPFDISNIDINTEPKENNNISTQNNTVEIGSNETKKEIGSNETTDSKLNETSNNKDSKEEVETTPKMDSTGSNDYKIPDMETKQSSEASLSNEAPSNVVSKVKEQQQPNKQTKQAEQPSKEKVESNNKSNKEANNKEVKEVNDKEESKNVKTVDNHGPIERKNKSDTFYKNDTTYKDPIKQKEKQLVNSVVGKLQTILNNYEKKYKEVETTLGTDIKTIKAERAKRTKSLKEFTGIKDIASRGKVKKKYFYEDLSITIEDLLEDIDENSYLGKNIIEEVNKIRPNSKIGIEILENNSISKTIEESLTNMLDKEIISEDVINSLEEITGCN